MKEVVIKPGTVINGLEDHEPAMKLSQDPVHSIVVKSIVSFSTEWDGWTISIKDASGLFWEIDNNDAELLEIINK